jgi:glycosyltransferase involved in cell wall biosynthesis
VSAHPLVSVIMPVQNGMPYLAEAIRSILGQTVGDLELIIVDDGSTDGSREFVESLKDKRIRFSSIVHGGVPCALNHGLRMAMSEFIARMDADDISKEVRLAKQLAFLLEHSEVGVVSSDVRLIDSKGDSIGNTTTLHRYNGRVRQALKSFVNPIVHPSVMMRRAVIDEVGDYDVRFATAEDYELWLRCSDRFEFHIIEEPLIALRKHGRNLSNRRSQQVDGLSALVGYRSVQSLGLKFRSLREYWGWSGVNAIVSSLTLLVPE